MFTRLKEDITRNGLNIAIISHICNEIYICHAKCVSKAELGLRTNRIIVKYNESFFYNWKINFLNQDFAKIQYWINIYWPWKKYYNKKSLFYISMKFSVGHSWKFKLTFRIMKFSMRTRNKLRCEKKLRLPMLAYRFFVRKS